MKKRRLIIFFLCICLCTTSITISSPKEVQAGIISDFINGIGNIFEETFENIFGETVINKIFKRAKKYMNEFVGNIDDMWKYYKDMEVPEDEFKILNEMLDTKYEIEMQYKSKKSDDKFKNETKEYKRWFDLELYKNTYNLIGGFGGTITGQETIIPPDLPQSGIIAECTNINYVGSEPYGQGWVEPCRSLYDLWVSKGRTTDRGIATIDGYYLVAVRARFGRNGDIIGIRLEDGTEIPAMIFDIKGNDSGEWGHAQGGGYSIVEWEYDGPQTHVGANLLNPDLEGWRNKKVVSIVNGGPYMSGVTGAGSAGSAEAHKAEDDDPYYKFMSDGDYSNISEVISVYMRTKWASVSNLLGSLQIESSAYAKLSPEIQKIEKEIDAVAEEYNFPVYKELFKAIAEYRHEGNGSDIFGMQNTKFNPEPGKKLKKEQSMKLAAQLFSQCLEVANYPDFTSAEDLKALLQAFEFESTRYITECKNKYSLKSAEAFAKKMCKNKERTDESQIKLYGKYDYKDQKFPEKVLKFYSAISIDFTEMTEVERQLVSEAMASWPADLDPRRKKVIEKALSLYGKISYSMGFRSSNPNPDAPIYLDCSSFVGWAYQKSGVGSADMSFSTVTFLTNFTKSVSPSELIPGDVGLDNASMETGGANHILLYIGKSAAGNNVWIHCTGYRGSKNGYPGPYVMGDSYVEGPRGSGNYHSINRGIMISDSVGSVENYPVNPPILRRSPLFGNK